MRKTCIPSNRRAARFFKFAAWKARPNGEWWLVRHSDRPEAGPSEVVTAGDYGDGAVVAVGKGAVVSDARKPVKLGPYKAQWNRLGECWQVSAYDRETGTHVYATADTIEELREAVKASVERQRADLLRQIALVEALGADLLGE